MKSKDRSIISSNKKAYFDYHVLYKFEAGIILVGSEVKSLRNAKCNLQDSFCLFPSKKNDELYVEGLHISPFEQANIQNHDPKRRRKLLLNKKELIKIRNQVNEKGYTIVPTEIYFTKHLVKLEIALVKPKKKYDKREVNKKKDSIIEINRTLKQRT